MAPKQVIIAFGIAALVALAGCSTTTTTPDDQRTVTPEPVESVNKSLDSAESFAVKYEGTTYQCVVYTDESLISGNGATAKSGMTCDETSETQPSVERTAPSNLKVFEESINGEKYVCFQFTRDSLISGNGATARSALSCVPTDGEESGT